MKVPRVCDKDTLVILFNRPIQNRELFRKTKLTFDQTLQSTSQEDLETLLKELQSSNPDDTRYLEAYTNFTADLISKSPSIAPSMPLDYYITDYRKETWIRFAFRRLMKIGGPFELEYAFIRMKDNATSIKKQKTQEFISELNEFIAKENWRKKVEGYILRKRAISFVKKYRAIKLLHRSTQNVVGKWVRRVAYQSKCINNLFKHVIKGIYDASGLFVQSKLRKGMKAMRTNARKAKSLNLLSKIDRKLTLHGTTTIFSLVLAASNSTKLSHNLLVSLWSLTKQSLLSSAKSVAYHNNLQHSLLGLIYHYDKVSFIKSIKECSSHLSKPLSLRKSLELLLLFKHTTSIHNQCKAGILTVRLLKILNRSFLKSKRKSFDEWNQTEIYFNYQFTSSTTVHQLSSSSSTSLPQPQASNNFSSEYQACQRLLSVINAALLKKSLSLESLSSDTKALHSNLNSTLLLSSQIEELNRINSEKIEKLVEINKEDTNNKELLIDMASEYRVLDARFSDLALRFSRIQEEDSRVDMDLKAANGEILIRKSELIRFEEELKRTEYEYMKKDSEKRNLNIESERMARRVNLSPVRSAANRSNMYRVSPTREAFRTVSPNREKKFDFLTGSTKAQTSQRLGGHKNIVPEQLNTVRRRIQYEEDSKTSTNYKLLVVSILLAVCLGLVFKNSL